MASDASTPESGSASGSAFEPRPAFEAFDRLARRRLLVVSGKGGVGRTTVSALLGLELAARGRRVLIGTTGHDDRLAWMLGREALTDRAVRVAPQLWIQRLVPSTCVREYGGIMMRSQRLSDMVFGNRLIKRMLGAVPGLDDYAVLGKAWHEAARGEDYDTVIFDGAASGHLRLNLGVPRAIVETAPQGILVDEAAAVCETLRDPEASAAVLVGLPETWPMTELSELARGLHEDVGLHLGALVVNKRWRADLPAFHEATGDGLDGGAGLGGANRLAYEALRRSVLRSLSEREAVAEWAARDATPALDEQARLDLPFMADGLDGPKAFEQLRARLAEAVGPTRSGGGPA